MIRSFQRLVIGVVVALALSGALVSCAPSSDRPVFPDIRFTDQPKLRLDVRSIDVTSEFHPTFQAPDVEHLFPVPPQRAAENWAHDRLEATGTTRRARVRILDASVKETELTKSESLSATFTKEQAERYDAAIEISVDILDERGFAERTITAKSTRTQSVPEGITPNERDTVWYNMTKGLMADEDKELEKQMRAVFTFYVQ